MRRIQKDLKKSGRMSLLMYPGVTPSVAAHCLTTFKTIFFISSSDDWNSRMRMIVTSLT